MSFSRSFSEGTPFFLDLDRASAVFALLFSLTRDDACTESDLESFEDSLFEITQGAQLPDGAHSRLRAVYEQTREEPEELSTIAGRVSEQFRGNRDALLALARVVLRLSMDDGMLCKRDKERIQQVMRVFDFSWMELDLLPHEERELLAYLCELKLDPRPAHTELSRHYEVLGCEPHHSDAHLRRAYRRLAMRYHPDRSAAQRTAAEKSSACPIRFRQVQDAYAAIMKVRSLA